MKHLVQWAVFALCGLAGAAACASEKSASAAKLSARDKTEVSALACGSVGTGGVDRVDATTRTKASRGIDAVVQCRSHGSEDARPVVRLVNCSSASGTWKCPDWRDSIQLELPSGKVLIVPDGVERRLAVNIAAEASKLTVPPFHRAAKFYMEGQCSLSPESGSAFKGAKNYAMFCSTSSLAITRDCWSKGCRVFITGGKGKWD